MTMLRKYLLLSFLSVVACGTPLKDRSLLEIDRHASAIIDGKACDEATFPETMGIVVNYVAKVDGEFVQKADVTCGATLIAPDVAVTAAHCVDADYLRKKLEAEGARTTFIEYYVSHRADLTNLLNGTEYVLPVDAVRVAAFHFPPEIDWAVIRREAPRIDWAHDLAVLFLSQPRSIQPAILVTPEEGRQLQGSHRVDVVGWGVTKVGHADSGGFKQCAQSTLVVAQAFDFLLSGADGSAQLCHGDFGGPAFAEVGNSENMQRRLVGVTSALGAQCTGGALDTYLGGYYDWINETMSAGCDEGVRKWCDVKGVIPASFYYPEPAKERAPFLDDSGCSAAGGATLVSMIALVALQRRRVPGHS